MIAIGVDPGANGGIVALDRSGKIVAASRTLMSSSDDGRASMPGTPRSFWDALGNVTAAAVEEPIMFVGGKAAPKSIVAVALSAGAWLSIVARYTDRVYLVSPRSWQAALLGPIAKGQSKARSEALARGLWPGDVRLQHSRGYHDGLCDAAALAEFIRQRAIREGWA